MSTVYVVCANGCPLFTSSRGDLATQVVCSFREDYVTRIRLEHCLCTRTDVIFVEFDLFAPDRAGVHNIVFS